MKLRNRFEVSGAIAVLHQKTHYVLWRSKFVISQKFRLIYPLWTHLISLNSGTSLLTRRKTAHRPRNYYRISIICPTLASRILADCHQEDNKLALVGNIFHSKKTICNEIEKREKTSNSSFYIKMVELKVPISNILKNLKLPLKMKK